MTFLSPCRPFCLSVDQPDTQTDQDQRYQTIHAEGLIAFIQQQRRQNNTDHRIHKTEYRNPADRIMLQKNSPQTVSYSLPPMNQPQAIRTRPPRKNCQPLKVTGFSRAENLLISTEENA